MSTAFAVPLCATCGQASSAGCPGCELRQAAGGPPYPAVRETPTRLRGVVIDGALMLVPVPLHADAQGRAAGNAPRLAPELIARQISAMEHEEARRQMPAVEPTPLLPVEMRVLLTEQEIAEASKPLGLSLSALLPRRFSAPAIRGGGRGNERGGADRARLDALCALVSSLPTTGATLTDDDLYGSDGGFVPREHGR